MKRVDILNVVDLVIGRQHEDVVTRPARKPFGSGPIANHLIARAQPQRLARAGHVDTAKAGQIDIHPAQPGLGGRDGMHAQPAGPDLHRQGGDMRQHRVEPVGHRVEVNKTARRGQGEQADTPVAPGGQHEVTSVQFDNLDLRHAFETRIKGVDDVVGDRQGPVHIQRHDRQTRGFMRRRDDKGRLSDLRDAQPRDPLQRH